MVISVYFCLGNAPDIMYPCGMSDVLFQSILTSLTHVMGLQN
jgi:hypothetical protein